MAERIACWFANPAVAGRWLLLVCLLPTLQGCTTFGYYGQAVAGQISILAKRKDIDQVLESGELSAEAASKLSLVRDARAFAVSQGLAAGRVFSQYVDVGRPYVVWNIFVAPEFSLELNAWCYPVAGCVTYRGFFSEDRARSEAAEYQQAGFDVHVGGVAAYSTLGWFDDPVLNTFFNRSDDRLAALVFHELAHRVAFVPGDTTFNESFATAVERILLRAWLAERDDGTQYAAYLAEAGREARTVRLIRSARDRLEALYRSRVAPERMRQQKVAIFADLQQAYSAGVTAGDFSQRYAGWMASNLNNARIATVGEYNDLVEPFEALYRSTGESLPDFLEAVRAIAALPDNERNSRLRSAGSHKQE